MHLIIAIIISFFLASPTQAINGECIQIQKTTLSTQCTETTGYVASTQPLQDCGSYENNRLCCCPQTAFSQTKPKTILIAAIIGFFAILTTAILIYKYNE